ncbi:hypothetical protein C8F04DRAFT_1271341 [Mycena alexandri]|uniref:Uncharacterized protein n=1 Tax=Mycena alexandri TaxID=1745969 RepID=A0AAD6S9Q7_9AGAR|nr:hypothetical protein C8F04DRAFT_1271341 [Mycena alexandri]
MAIRVPCVRVQPPTDVTSSHGNSNHRTPKYSTFSSTARIAVFDCAALSHSRRPPSRGYDYIISPSSLPPPTPSSPHFQLSAFTHHFPGTPPRFSLCPNSAEIKSYGLVVRRLHQLGANTTFGFFGSALVLGSGGFAMKTSFPIVRVREDVLRGLFDPPYALAVRPWGFSMATGAFVDAFPSSAYGWSALDVLSGVVNHSPQSMCRSSSSPPSHLPLNHVCHRVEELRWWSPLPSSSACARRSEPSAQFRNPEFNNRLIFLARARALLHLHLHRVRSTCLSTIPLRLASDVRSAARSRSNAHHLPPPCPRTRESPSAFDLDGAHARRIPPPSSGGAIPPPCLRICAQIAPIHTFTAVLFPSLTQRHQRLGAFRSHPPRIQTKYFEVGDLALPSPAPGKALRCVVWYIWKEVKSAATQIP